MGAGHAIHPGSPRVQSSPASPTSGSAQGTARSWPSLDGVLADVRRLASARLPENGARADHSISRSSSSTRLPREMSVVAAIVNSVRRFASVVEWTFGDGIVARAHGDYREAESDRQLAIRVQMSP